MIVISNCSWFLENDGCKSGSYLIFKNYCFVIWIVSYGVWTIELLKKNCWCRLHDLKELNLCWLSTNHSKQIAQIETVKILTGYFIKDTKISLICFFLWKTGLYVLLKVLPITSPYFFLFFYQRTDTASEKTLYLLRLFTNRSHFWYLHAMCSGRPWLSFGTSDNRKGQCLVNTIVEVFSIECFYVVFWSALKHVDVQDNNNFVVSGVGVLAFSVRFKLINCVR